MDPSSQSSITIKDDKGATLAANVSIDISSDGTNETFELESTTAQMLSIGTIYLAYFTDGSQPRAFTRQGAGTCRFYPRLIGRQVQSFDLGGLTLSVTKSQVILDAIASNKLLNSPLMLTNLQNLLDNNAVVCEEGTRIQFEVTGPWPERAKGLKWEIRVSDDNISSGYAAPRLGPAGDSLLVVIDRYMDTNASIMVESLSAAQLTSTDSGMLPPKSVAFRFFRLNGFNVAATSDVAALPLMSLAAMPVDSKRGAVVRGPEHGDSIVAGTLSDVTCDATPFAEVMVSFFVTPSKAIADALFSCTH